ncbi:aspartyl-phosphate phosphatase Spo0E family protein [Priestia aryabhattai]
MIKKNSSSGCPLLIAKIEYFREKMVNTGLKEGFSNPKTIELSQNLDILLNKLAKTSQVS